MRSRVTLVPALAVLLLAACVAGCGGGESAPATLPLGEESTTQAQSPSPATDPVDAVRAADDAPDLEPVRFVLGADPVFDPVEATANDPAQLQVLDLVYEGLTRWDPVERWWAPGLAATIDSSPDGRTWTFTLPDDLTFSDGSPLSAHQVVRSIERVRRHGDPAVALRFAQGTTFTAEGQVVVARLPEPDATFPVVLSSPLFGAVPTGAGAVLNGTVGSGSHVVQGEGVGAEVRLVPVPAMIDIVPPVMLVRSIEGPLTQAGVDVAFGETATPPPGSDAGVAEGYFQAPSLVEIHFGLNVTSWKLADPQRRAIVVSAVDQSRFVRHVGLAVAIDELAPDARMCGDDCGGEVLETTVTLPPLFVDYVTSDGPAGEVEAMLAEELAAQLRRAGVKTEARGHSLDEYVALVAAGEHEIYRTGCAGLAWPSIARLAPYQTAGVDNVSGYTNADVDAAIAAARRARTADEFWTAYVTATEAIDGDDAVVPVLQVTLPIYLAPRFTADGGPTAGTVRPDGTVDLAMLVR